MDLRTDDFHTTKVFLPMMLCCSRFARGFRYNTHKDGPQILKIDSIVCLTLRMQVTITVYLPSWHQVLAVPLAHRRTCSLRQPGLLQCCVSKCELCFFYGLFHVSGCLNNRSPQVKLVRHDTSILTAMCIFHLIGKCVNQI